MSAEESGHWYKRSGEPCYEVPNSTGGMRGINLRWDRKLQLVPSVTTVLQVVAKPALENWKVEQGILAALTLPKNSEESEDDYIDRIKDDSKQQARKAAEEGTRIHRAIKAHFDGRTYPDKYVPHVKATLAEIKRLFPAVNDWVSEKTFAHPMGFGGATDLHSPSTGIVIDYKGRDGDFTELDDYGKPKKLHWDQHWQLAAYQVGLGLRGRYGAPIDNQDFQQCANIFVSRTHPGCVASHVWSVDDIAHGWSVFSSALELWRHLKKYDPSF